MSSTLTLQNRAPSETIARVTIFSRDGTRQDLAPIPIAPHSFVQVNLADVIDSEQFKSGNLQVAFTGPPMILAAQISITSSEHRLSYESRAQAAMDFLSTKLNGILWLPRRGAEGSLAVTNVAPTSVTVHLQFAGKQEILTLPPRNTEVVKLNQVPDGQASTPMLIKLEHDGLAGEILTTGFVLDPGTGYSSTFTMFDSAIMNSSELAGVHFRFGLADPAEGFPEGTAFRAPLLLANVGAQPANARISVDYTTAANSFDHVAVKKLRLAPGEVQRIELSEELARLGIAGPVREAGVEILHDAPPGSVIGELTSFDQSGDFSFEVPIKDPAAFNEQMEGIYPWMIRDSVRSVLHLKNTTADQATALVIFDFPDGKFYQPSRITLQPFESTAIDVGMLKYSGLPDTRNRVFPGEETTGLVQWRQEIPRSMIGRLEQVDRDGRVAHSFSCGQTCCSNFTESGYVTPGSVTGPVGASFSLAARVRGTDCNGVAFDNPTSATGWSSNNTNVATVDSSGNVTLKGPGSATITAQIVVDFYFEFSIFPNSPPQCDLGSRTQNATASITSTPSISSISPAQGPGGISTSVTITGTGFASGATVNAGSNISVSNVSVSSSTKITATFTPSNSAGGNQSVTVSAGGHTSNSVNFFVQIPTSLSIVPGTDSTTSEASCTFTSGGKQFTGCGLARSFTYQVKDQAGNPINAVMPFWDSFGTVSPNPLNIGGFTTTCSPANTGPCGVNTDAQGQFLEKSLSLCSTVCRSNGVCVAGGPSVVGQTWHVGSAAITQTISYYCQKVLVNGQ